MPAKGAKTEAQGVGSRGLAAGHLKRLGSVNMQAQELALETLEQDAALSKGPSLGYRRTKDLRSEQK